MVDAITETTDNENEKRVAIKLTTTDSDIERLNQEDEAISRFLEWALTVAKQNCPSIGRNLIPKEPAVQHGPGVVLSGQFFSFRKLFCTESGFNLFL